MQHKARWPIWCAILSAALGIVLLLGGGCAGQPPHAGPAPLEGSAPAATAPQDIATPPPPPSATPTLSPEAASPPAGNTPTATALPPTGVIVVRRGQDTTLDAWAPTRNWGADTRTRVRQGNITSALLRFEGIPLPPSARIDKATLRLFVVSQSNWRSLTLVAYAVRRPWDGASATWQQAASGQPWAVAGCDGVPEDREGAALVRALLPKQSNPLEVEVTEAVRRWVADPASNQGLLLKGEGGASVEYTLASFEHGIAEWWPQLIIHYALPTLTPSPTATATPTPSITPTPTETPTPSESETPTPSPTPSEFPTPTSTKTEEPIPSPTPSETPRPTETFTPGPSPTPVSGSMTIQTGNDTTLHSWFPNTPFGSESRLTLRQDNVASALLRFDPIPLPRMATVNSAKLRMYVASQSNVHTVNVVAYNVRRNWDELNANWQRASATQSWTTPGCNGVPSDREGTALARAIVPSVGNWLELDVTAAARQWVATPERNYGLLLRAEGSVAVESRVASFEYHDPVLRPMLIIQYSIPYPGPSPTPTRTPTRTPTPRATNTPGPKPATAWTFMIYVAGDNNLSGYLKNDLRLLEKLPANPDVKIVVLADLMDNYDWRYEVQPNGNYTVGVNKWFLGEVNTGDPKTLSDFITWGKENYPAEHYCVAIIDHGRGTTGMARDETNNYDILTAAELRTAFRNATQDGTWRIDVLHYYACLMGMLEQAYEVKDYADYWIACQNIGWLIPLYERYFSTYKVGANTTPREVAVGIAETYYKDAMLTKSLRDMSVVDLTQIDAVNEALDRLAMTLKDHIGQIKTSVPAIRNATQKLDSRDYFRINNYDEYLDLYDLALRLQEHVTQAVIVDAASALVASLNNFIVACYHDDGRGGAIAPIEQSLANIHGISIYFPPDGNTWDYTYYVTHRLFTFTKESLWDDFLTALYGTKRPPQPPPAEIEWPPFLRP